MSGPAFPRGNEEAPRAVCARWMGTAPCGSLAVTHIIWNAGMRNGPVCERHDREIDERGWDWIGRHPYSLDCRGGAEWVQEIDRCVRPRVRSLEERPGHWPR